MQIVPHDNPWTLFFTLHYYTFTKLGDNLTNNDANSNST